MDRQMFLKIEQYMQHCMSDSAHDTAHVYRVLYNALDIAAEDRNADTDVLIAACLLHDIGRADQFRDPSVCHAKVGSEKAYSFLLSLGFDETFCSHVQACIATHRFRKDARPATIEAKILFDADKLDAAGALGIARTLLYQGTVQAPLYVLGDDGSVSDGRDDAKETFFGEYHYKLEKLYGQFLTSRGSALAQQRQQAARDFCDSLLSEVRYPYEHGSLHLQKYLDLP